MTTWLQRVFSETIFHETDLAPWALLADNPAGTWNVHPMNEQITQALHNSWPIGQISMPTDRLGDKSDIEAAIHRKASESGLEVVHLQVYPLANDNDKNQPRNDFAMILKVTIKREVTN